MTIYTIHTEWYHKSNSQTRTVDIPENAKHVTLYDRYVLYATVTAES